MAKFAVLVSCVLLAVEVASAGRVKRGGYHPPGIVQPPAATTKDPTDPNPDPIAPSPVVENEVIPEFNIRRDEYGADALPKNFDANLTAKAQDCAERLINRNLCKGATVPPANIDTPRETEVLCSDSETALQYFGFGPADEASEREVTRSVVKTWLGEGDIAPVEPIYVRAKRHFTQIIWKGLEKVGCAVSKYSDTTCDNRKILVCFFDPPGNVQYGENNVAFRANIGKPTDR